MTNLDSILKSRHYIANKGPSSQGYGFSCGHVWMGELDCEEGWAPKNWHFWSVVLEKTLESPLDCKEINPVYPKRNQSWIFTGRTDAKAEAPILWPLDGKSWITGKDPDIGKERKQGAEGDDRGWDGWMASPTQWTWVWASSGSGWWTRKPGMLQSMGSQRVRHDWATELNPESGDGYMFTLLYISLSKLWTAHLVLLYVNYTLINLKFKMERTSTYRIKYNCS